jgi:hypothetical protein
VSTFTLTQAYAAIDDANLKDPNTVIVDGRAVAAEWVYGQRMTDCLSQFDPTASTALCIAVRAQHIERWVIARSEYPQDRAGYHRWRTALGRHHAQRTQELLIGLHADPQLIDTVGRLLRKENLKSNSETQTLEDVACLVFLQYYLEPFSQKHETTKLIAIIQKTWRKMSEKGQQAALQVSLPTALSQLIQRALTD